MTGSVAGSVPRAWKRSSCCPGRSENAATVDVLSNRRFDLGVGLGYVPHEFEGFGISRHERGTRMEDGIAVIRGAWTEDDFAFSGRHFQLSQINLTPRPVQEPHAPIWIGALGPKAIERAARLGCHYIGLSDPQAQETYDAALLADGRDPAHFQAAHLRWAYVASDRDQARQDVQEHLHYMLTVYGKWLAQAMDFEGESTPVSPCRPPPSSVTLTPSSSARP